jgi:hypothetical protein
MKQDQWRLVSKIAVTICVINGWDGYYDIMVCMVIIVILVNIAIMVIMVILVLVEIPCE